MSTVYKKRKIKEWIFLVSWAFWLLECQITEFLLHIVYMYWPLSSHWFIVLAHGTEVPYIDKTSHLLNYVNDCTCSFLFKHLMLTAKIYNYFSRTICIQLFFLNVNNAWMTIIPLQNLMAISRSHSLRVGWKRNHWSFLHSA